MSSADAEIYAALGRVLSRLNVRWYVFGAQAAILYGAARFTEDVDVTVEIGSLEASAFVSALAGAGFTPRINDRAFIDQTRVIPVLHESTKTPLDIVLAGPGIEELFFDGVRIVEVSGQRVPVASPEDLVVMKVLAGRPKDLEDVVAVLAAQGQLDEERIRWLLDLLQQALDQSDLLPVFERCLTRAIRGRARPSRDR
ncbi:MAG: nucleotidyltransferase [Myxococcota bacterium]|jgi:Nucleotidyl transferase AbiEii toxin, Type IV TA system|nr:nucleotidyltransferase [Myxococcota bacterium]